MLLAYYLFYQLKSEIRFSLKLQGFAKSPNNFCYFQSLILLRVVLINLMKLRKLEIAFLQFLIKINFKLKCTLLYFVITAELAL